MGRKGPPRRFVRLHRMLIRPFSDGFMTEFAEVVAPASQVCYLVSKRSGRERVGNGQE